MRKTTSNDFYHSVLGGGTGADARADGLSLTMSGCAISPNSASCERVFALSSSRTSSTSSRFCRSPTTNVQAALMLNYNNRSVG